MSMARRIPLLPTLLVLAAVAVMIRLGFWQIDRMHQKDALVASYAQAHTLSADVPFPQSEPAAEPLYYRHARVDCIKVLSVTSIAGRSAQDELGQAHVAYCLLAGGGKARVVLGWSRDPAVRIWAGGIAAGVIAPGPRLVADPPLAGLAPMARPDPAGI